jgi:hypothetical protein
MEKKIRISKLDAAKRQLETAIRLYFNYGDTVSIHFLACAAHEILSDLNKNYRGTPMIVSDYMIKDDAKSRFMNIIRKPQNFFKHADKDPENAIDFKPEVIQYFIFDAIRKYQEITGENVPYFIIFKGWFAAHNIEAFNYSVGEKTNCVKYSTNI